MIENNFRKAIKSAGIGISEEILADGKIHRFHINGDNSGSKNGWYILHGDDTPAGTFGCFKRDICGTWTDKDFVSMTEEEKARFSTRIEMAKQQRRCAEDQLKTDCQTWCADTFNKAKTATNEHPYLKRKGVQAYGVKQLGGNLLVPLRDGSAVIHGLQFIMPEGTKKFKTGTSKQGNYFSIGKPHGNILIICEGYATGASLHHSTGHAVAVAFDAGNLLAVAKGLRRKFPNIRLIICADNDESGVGQEKAKEAALAVAGLVAMPPEAGDDFNDLHQKQGAKAVKACLEQVLVLACKSGEITQLRTLPQTDNPSNDETDNAIHQTLIRLAALPPLQYDLARKREAESLGVRTTALDQAVKEIRKSNGIDNDLPYKEIYPWPEEVCPAEILSEVESVVKRFIVCDKEIPVAVALWCAMTWFLDVFHICPLAVITAPEKRCGKSQLLTLIGKLVCRPIAASSISPAALFRSIDAWKPTLLIDECDACMKDNEELRGIINSGHTRDSAYVIRTVGDAFIPTKFSTWGAKALSGIGHVADTLMDRSIVLELRRKLSHENVDRLRYAEPGLFENLAAKLARFAIDYSDQVRQARPCIPSRLNDRAQDNWEPLLAIAMVAEGEWLSVATKAALKLAGSESAVQSIGVELLSDIQQIFEEKAIDRISTADLIKALCVDDEKNWATYNKGFPIKPRQLASRLKGYGITSKNVRFNSMETLKGFDKRQFSEAFSRYIPSSPSLSATAPPAFIEKCLSVADNSPHGGIVADRNICNYPETLPCGGVADRIHFSGVKERIEVTI